MRKLISVVIFVLTPLTLFPCTTAIVSGKATVDGRPLLWKHRDTNYFQNSIMYFEDGKYPYIGLINAEDAEGEEIWAGVNAAGFAIMNSASYNLKPDDDTTTAADREGIVMKIALQQCATVEDFEMLLHNMPKPLGVEANFGVIDAYGGAAFYETDNYTYRKFDVNDPRVAPNGFLIRSNFSYSRAVDEGYGYIRYDTANELFEERLAKDGLSAEFILSTLSRSLIHSRTGVDLRKTELKDEGSTQFSFFRDFIPRYTSTSSIVVRGVHSEESPDYTTMFTLLGFPLTSVTVPLWVAGKDDFPDFLKAGEMGVASLCEASLRLKSACFPIVRGSGKDYIDLNILLNREGTGILQLIPDPEKEIYLLEEEFYRSMITEGIDRFKIREFYSGIETLVTDFYRNTFGISLR